MSIANRFNTEYLKISGNIHITWLYRLTLTHTHTRTSILVSLEYKWACDYVGRKIYCSRYFHNLSQDIDSVQVLHAGHAQHIAEGWVV